MAFLRAKRTMAAHAPLVIRKSGVLSVLASAALLAGCNTVLMKPSGDVAAQQGHLIVVSTVLMLLIIVPVIVLTFFFAWRYRHSNANAAAHYQPDWDHSLQLELVIWAAPLLIIIALGALAWISTHTLDPYRPIGRLDARRPFAANVKPLVVDVVALDWKWLFIYPEQGIATVNELAAPVDVPIEFRITAESVMNSFFIPALAGQIYAMPGMETQLHAVINRAGSFRGFSANYSGAGFSGMHFLFHGMSAADFDAWVAGARATGGALDRAAYRTLAAPSADEPVHRYATVESGLYDAIVERCLAPGQMCMRETMSRNGGEPMAMLPASAPSTAATPAPAAVRRE
jgi:cytochrome o ubiquinol oxidase subunit 2